MTGRYFQGIAMELALKTAGHKFPRLSQVGAEWATENGGPTKVEINPPSERPVRVDTPGTDDFGFFLLDLTLSEDGRICLIEANGSNAALSSCIVGRDDRRALHMFLSYRSKKKMPGSVV